MTKDENRICKMNTCKSIKFHAKDIDGDTIFVDIEDENAQTILNYIKNGIIESNKPGNKSLLIK